jgi:hypothetical protein
MTLQRHRVFEMKKYTWREAFEDSYEAALQGNSRAQNFVGYCYDQGRGVGRNPKAARRWYETATQHGNLDATFNLALMTQNGAGGRQDSRRAVCLYRKAALLGDLPSQANLALMLLDGEGVNANVPQGLHWLRRAAKRGDPIAQYNLGIAYATGTTFPRAQHTPRGGCSKLLRMAISKLAFGCAL